MLQVKQMTQFRQTLPAGATTYVCKNTLLKVAAEKQGWQNLIPSAKVNHWQSCTATLFYKIDTHEAEHAVVLVSHEHLGHQPIQGICSCSRLILFKPEAWHS